MGKFFLQKLGLPRAWLSVSHVGGRCDNRVVLPWAAC